MLYSNTFYLLFFLPCLRILKEMRGFLAWAWDFIVHIGSSMGHMVQPQRQVASLSKLSLTFSHLVPAAAAPSRTRSSVPFYPEQHDGEGLGNTWRILPQIWHAFIFRKRWFKLCSVSVQCFMVQSLSKKHQDTRWSLSLFFSLPPSLSPSHSPSVLNLTLASEPSNNSYFANAKQLPVPQNAQVVPYLWVLPDAWNVFLWLSQLKTFLFKLQSPAQASLSL